VVYVRDQLHRSAADVPFALGAYGAGSMTAALLLPRVLERVRERTVLLGGGFAITLLFLPLAAVTFGPSAPWQWSAMLATWAGLGAASAVVNAPAGRLIRGATAPEQRADAFAAQFSLSHGCWLLTYPLAGWLGATVGLSAALLALGALALIAAVTAARIWSGSRRELPPRAAVAAPASLENA
jgi:predicted MFS family arabinose efflux permease